MHDTQTKTGDPSRCRNRGLDRGVGGGPDAFCYRDTTFGRKDASRRMTRFHPVCPGLHPVCPGLDALCLRHDAIHGLVQGAILRRGSAGSTRCTTRCTLCHTLPRMRLALMFLKSVLNLGKAGHIVLHPLHPLHIVFLVDSGLTPDVSVSVGLQPHTPSVSVR